MGSVATSHGRKQTLLSQATSMELLGSVKYVLVFVGCSDILVTIITRSPAVARMSDHTAP